MSISLILPVADVDSLIGTGSNQFDTLKLYRAPTRGGTYTLVTSITLVAGTTQYPYTDVSGLSTSWYKLTYFNSVTVFETPIAESEPFPAKRGTTSLQTLREMVIRNFGGEVYTPSVYGAQTATSLALIDTSDVVNEKNGWHLYRPAQAGTNDADKRVTGYAPSTGQLTHAGTPYVVQAIGTEVFETMPVDISFVELNNKISDGLQRARYLYRYEFGAQSGNRNYNLPFFVEDPQYVVEMWKRFGTVGSTYSWQLFSLFGRWWRVRGSAFKCILDINPPQGDNDVLALDVWRPGDPLDGDTDFTLVHKLWAEAAAMVSVCEFLFNRDSARHTTGPNAWGTLLQSWSNNLRQRARAYGPIGGMRIQLPQPFRGFPEV